MTNWARPASRAKRPGAVQCISLIEMAGCLSGVSLLKAVKSAGDDLLSLSGMCIRIQRRLAKRHEIVVNGFFTRRGVCEM